MHFYYPAAWNADVMAGALAINLDYEAIIQALRQWLAGSSLVPEDLIQAQKVFIEEILIPVLLEPLLFWISVTHSQTYSWFRS